MSHRYRFTILACARWESGYIVEWLNYYRALGYDHVYLYCNDDDPAEMYDRVLPFSAGPAPFVTFRYYPHQGQQLQMYADFVRNDIDVSEWLSIFDIDEFLRLPPGETIGKFLGRFDDSVDCVLFNWIFFGPNGHQTPPAGHVLENFTQRERNIHPFTKYIAKSSVFTGVKFFDPDAGHGFWHSLHDKAEKPFNAVNVLGEDMRDYYEGFPDIPAAFANNGSRKNRILETAIIHHYAFRSERAFWERSARGLLGAFDGQSMWQRIAEGPNFGNYLATVNAQTDTSLARFWADLSARAWETNILARPSGKLISKGRPALQSSVSEWSRRPTPEEDAAGAVNGQIDGRRKFHTAFQDNPWWQVDLGGFATIREIHIYNTTDPVAERFKNFCLEVSIDAAVWIEIARKEDDAVVGGIHGGKFVWNGPGTAWARFIRITLLGRDFLHLDQVEVFGSLGDETIIAPPVQGIDAARFSKVENPLGGRGFVLGWEGAKLGNRLTSFANLFALTQMTGIPTGYAEILSCQNLLEIPGRQFYANGDLSSEQFAKLDGLTGFVDELFSKGYEDYNDRFMTVSLEKLHELKTESGIIVFSRYRPGFQDLAAEQDAIKSFCGRGNGIILAGAFWHHYLDMRQLRREGEALRRKLRINRADAAGVRAEAMRNAGEETLRIGIHIRQGDYKIWQGGKFYFSSAQYEALIRRIHADLAGRPHYFCLCSDAALDMAPLHGLPILYERAAMLDDFVALSNCHYVIGPPSSFGTWSAFLGGGRRVVLTPEQMADPGALPPILETAVEIIYPTGGYLPGDPAAGPI